MNRSPDTTYRGEPANGTVTVYVEENGVTTELEPARVVKEDHTENDLSTGYPGRGPLNLAKSLLADLYDEDTAQEYGMALRTNLTEKLEDDFEITAREIDEVFQNISP